MTNTPDGPQFLEPNDLSTKLQEVFSERYAKAAMELQAWSERHGLSLAITFPHPHIKKPVLVFQFGGREMASITETILKQGTYVVSADDPPLEMTGDL